MANERDVSSGLLGQPSKADTLTGAVVTPGYARRDVMYYAVSEAEINSLTLFNGLALAFSSVGSFLFALATSIWIGASLAEELNEVAEILLYGCSPILAVLAFAFYYLTYSALKSRWSQIDIIRKESGGETTQNISESG